MDEAICAVVTGGSSGIGAAIVTALVRRGHPVVNVDPDADVDPPPKVRRIRGSASDPEVLRRAFDAADEIGGLGVFVANAGLSRPGTSRSYRRADWDALLELNLTAVFEGARSASERMRSGGRIVAISSIAGALGFSGRAAYCASKAGVEGLVRSLAVEWAPLGITVNAVAPGYVETPLVARNVAKGVVDLEKLLARIPLGRLAGPQEIAEVVAFLASPSASYITGSTVTVDGGMSVLGMGVGESA